jgi:hypothetical protein
MGYHERAFQGSVAPRDHARSITMKPFNSSIPLLACVLLAIVGCSTDTFGTGDSSSGDSGDPADAWVEDGKFGLHPDAGAADADSGSLGDASQDATTADGGGWPRRVFVSSGVENYDALQIGGLAGADGHCSQLATNAGLGGTWKAWMSSSTSAVSARFTTGGGPFELLNGTVVAADWKTLTSGTLQAPINRDENDVALPSVEYVWTGTTPQGDAVSGDNCNDWWGPSDGGFGGYFSYGRTDVVDAGWSQQSQTGTCASGETYLYCFEQ